MANLKFTTIKHNFSISFNESTVVREVKNIRPNCFSGMGFNFTKLGDIEKTVGLFMIDTIAVVTEVQPVGQITMKSTGEMRDKRTITLTDDSNVSIQATIWGENATRGDIQVGSILATKGAKISDYGGKSLNIGDSLVINPVNDPRYKELSKWYRAQTAGGKEIKTQQLTQVGESSINIDSYPLLTFQEMENLVMSDHDFQAGNSEPKVFKVRGYISRIMSDRPLFYASCVECKKKV